MPLKTFNRNPTQSGLRSLWRAVVSVTVYPAESSQSSETEIYWRACDGPSCPRRSVLPCRREVQRVVLSTQFVRILSVLERHTLDGPSWDPSTQTVITRNKIYCPKRLTGRYNRYQFTHRSSPDDQKKENKGDSSTGRFYHCTLMDAISLDLNLRTSLSKMATGSSS